MNEGNVPAIARLVREHFPELNNRAFAIMEADLTKENQPNLPLCFVALLGIDALNNSNDVSTPVDLLEHIMIEFWLSPVTHNKTDGSTSPFYAYQNYEDIMNRLLSALDGYFTPRKKPVRFVSMITHSDEVVLTVTFRVSVKWRWCNDITEEGTAIRIRFKVDPSIPSVCVEPVPPVLTPPDEPPPIIDGPVKLTSTKLEVFYSQPAL